MEDTIVDYVDKPGDVKTEMELVTLKQKLRLSQCKTQQTVAQLELQKLRTKQLVTAWRARIEEAEGTLEQRRRHWDHQLQELSGQLLFLEGQLRLEQRDIAEKLDAKDRVIREQQHRIQSLLIQNRRLKELLLNNYKGVSVVQDADLEDGSKEQVEEGSEELKGGSKGPKKESKGRSKGLLDIRNSSLKGFAKEADAMLKDSGMDDRRKVKERSGHKTNHRVQNTQKNQMQDESNFLTCNADEYGLRNGNDLKVTQESELCANKLKTSKDTRDGFSLLEREHGNGARGKNNHVYQLEMKCPSSRSDSQSSTQSKVTLVEKLMKMHNMRLELCSTEDSSPKDEEDVVFFNRIVDEDVVYYDRADVNDSVVAYDEENDDDVFYDDNEIVPKDKDQDVMLRDKLRHVVHGAKEGYVVDRVKEEHVVDEENEGNDYETNQGDLTYLQDSISSPDSSTTILTQSYSSDPCDRGNVAAQGEATDHSLKGLHLDTIQSQDKLKEGPSSVKSHSYKSTHVNGGYTQCHLKRYHIKGRPELGHTKGQPDVGHTKGQPDVGHTKRQPDVGHTKGQPDVVHTKGQQDVGHAQGPDSGHVKVKDRLQHQPGKVKAQYIYYKDTEDTKTSSVAQRAFHNQNGISRKEKTESQRSRGTKDTVSSILCTGNKSLEQKDKLTNFQNTPSDCSTSDPPKHSDNHKIPIQNVSRHMEVTGKLSLDVIRRQVAVTAEDPQENSTTERNIKHENAVNVDRREAENSPAHSSSSTKTHRKLTSLKDKNFSKSSPQLNYTLPTDSVKDKPEQKSFFRPRDLRKRSQARSRSNSAAEMTPEMSAGKERKKGLAKFLTFKF